MFLKSNVTSRIIFTLQGVPYGAFITGCESRFVARGRYWLTADFN